MAILNLPVVNDDTFAIALPKDSKDIGKINDILKEMKQNGEFHKILVKYLGEEATKAVRSCGSQTGHCQTVIQRET